LGVEGGELVGGELLISHSHILPHIQHITDQSRQKRRFPTAHITHHTHKLALFDLQIDIPQSQFTVQSGRFYGQGDFLIIFAFGDEAPRVVTLDLDGWLSPCSFAFLHKITLDFIEHQEFLNPIHSLSHPRQLHHLYRHTMEWHSHPRD